MSTFVLPCLRKHCANVGQCVILVSSFEAKLEKEFSSQKYIRQYFLFEMINFIIYPSCRASTNIAGRKCHGKCIQFTVVETQSHRSRYLYHYGFIFLISYVLTHKVSESSDSLAVTQIYCNFSGPRFKDAFQDANSYLAIEPVFEV